MKYVYTDSIYCVDVHKHEVMMRMMEKQKVVEGHLVFDECEPGPVVLVEICQLLPSPSDSIVERTSVWSM